ncbi:hypothetical protein HMPREF9120_00216 [Neisseria sp. oral taxon 020 str. F0370]|nr:hypothetical protein HMPREF9120_00216 [Neisseria sp. oral taxon 020 str. F0370]
MPLHFLPRKRERELGCRRVLRFQAALSSGRLGCQTQHLQKFGLSDSRIRPTGFQAAFVAVQAV